MNAGTDDSANTEVLGKLGGEVGDEVEGVDNTLSTNGVEGTAVGEIVKTEPASNKEKSEVMGRANKALCLTLKSFYNSTLSPTGLADDSSIRT